MRIFYDDLMRDLAIAATGSRSGFPVANVQHPWLTRVWRSLDLSAQRITVDAGSGLTISPTAAAIIAHNLTSTATAKIQANSVDDWAAPPLDQAFDPADEIAFSYFDAAAYQYWSFYFLDAANPDGYVEIGRLRLDAYWQSTEETERGTEDGVEDTTVETVSVTGQVFADLGKVARKYKLSMGIMQDETRIALKAAYAVVGRHTPIILVPNERATDKLPPIYCRFTKANAFTGAGAWQWRDDGLEFTEVF